MSKPIVFKEYEQKNHSETQLGKGDLEELQKYIDRQNLSSALNITPNWIKAKSCVGVIKYKNIHLQILLEKPYFHAFLHKKAGNKDKQCG